MKNRAPSGQTWSRTKQGDRSSRRRGIAGVLVVILLPVLLGMGALSIDLGYMYLVKQQLQTAADAGAMAAAWSLFDEAGAPTLNAAQQQGQTFAALNAVNGVTEVTFGFVVDPLDPASPFVPTVVAPLNAVRVTVLRTTATGNPVELFFAAIFGQTKTDLQATAVVAYSPVAAVDALPIALPAPGFGPIDPKVAEANPGKAGPSEPQDGNAFQIGEQVTLFTFGEGKKSPVHLVLNTNDKPGEGELEDILEGEEPPVKLAIGDEVDVLGKGTGHDDLGEELADRLDDDDPANDTFVVAVVEPLPNSRNAKGELDGNVRIIDFVAVHLDGIVEQSVPDPNDPQNKGKTIDIELLVGTVVQQAVGGTPGTASSGVVAGVSVGRPLLIR